MSAPIVGPRGTAVGPEVIAGVALTSSVLSRADVDPNVKQQLLKVFGDLLPGRPLRTGTAGPDRSLNPDVLSALIPSAAVVASGMDPATTPNPAPAVLWQSGNQQLLVMVGKVQASLGPGLIEFTIPVSCDQTGDTSVTVTFVTGTPDRPAGGIMSTEDHPRGPAVIVENWAEALIAFAWHTLVIATSALSGVSGADSAGRSLVTAGVSATSDGLTLTPMARNVFGTRAATK